MPTWPRDTFYAPGTMLLGHYMGFGVYGNCLVVPYKEGLRGKAQTTAQRGWEELRVPWVCPRKTAEDWLVLGDGWRGMGTLSCLFAVPNKTMCFWFLTVI